MQDPAYWASWTITHFSNMALSGLLCALVGLYPFSHSSAGVLLLFYWLVALALISFAYCLSTLFSKSRVAGTATAVIYAICMVPGCAQGAQGAIGRVAFFTVYAIVTSTAN